MLIVVVFIIILRGFILVSENVNINIKYFFQNIH